LSLRAVFFDFDGVIANSEPLHLRAYQAVLQPEGIDLDEEDYYSLYLGYDDVGLFETLTKDRGIAVTTARIEGWIARKSAIIRQMLSRDSILFPGARDCVRTFAQRVPLAIASGALEPEIDMVLQHAGLRDCFTAIASASDGVRGKPAPDLYLLAMAKLRQSASGMAGRFDAASCVAIEDSHWGLVAAQQAGLRCIAVTHTYPASELAQADLVVERLSDLTWSSIARLMGDNGRTP
jgi:beta-phosphoglucomutase